MKFGKELRAQMVQEWQGAYVDYNHLKKLLKDIIKQNSGRDKARTGFLKTKRTIHRSFSGLTWQTNNIAKSQNVNEEILESPTRQQAGSEISLQALFLRSPEQGRELEQIFFGKLDDEFNKVVKFYSWKVEEVKLRAEKLSKQMDALIALRIRVGKPYVKDSSVVNEQNQGDVQKDNTIKEADQMRNRITSEDQQITTEEKNKDFRASKAASPEILDYVKINVTPETPRSTLRSVIKSPISEPSFSEEEVCKAEKKLRRAFVEFYQQLRLLKSYRFSNKLAFSKIMKKYDKITSRNTSSIYLEIVEKSYLGSSDEVNTLMDKLETSFIKHFANGNRRKGMKFLRPREKKEKHLITFFLGLFTGCSIALIAGLIISIHARNLLDHEGREQYMSNIFPLYSLFMYIVLHMLMYGVNTYFWRRYRVNYPFIFGYKPGTELGFREVLLLASGLSVLAFAAVLANLDMEMDPDTQSFQTITELVPLGLVIVVLAITFCPFNIIYRSSRFFLIQSVWRCILAPLYMVTFSDFFLADQLTSQVQAIRSLQFYVCYYGWGDFRRRSNKCLESNLYEKFYIAIAIIPFLARFLQCLRRVFEEKNVKQGFNGLKYFSTVVALVTRTMYSLRRQMLWRIMAASTSGITTIYNTYWDIVEDWGLLRKNAKNKWLRDNLLISSKAVYFIAIVVNICLRLVWMQLILDFNETPFLHRNSMIALVACLEIFRRGVWNFFRLENEHFNNVGNFRAFKSVPLPFYYEDEKFV
ncbi:hypothetical protein CASFOL_011828 [Castilleja foliolosa]|uniref:Uncharacterized protein n=1 Tax=Castilleja foliolosa TaxID=1961234 RepID=A0ABD3DNQ6_9LAMI